jgi:hypothetical protein
MLFDRNSWHARLNEFTYEEDVSLNSSLCMYFWKTASAFPLSILAIIGMLTKLMIHAYQRRVGISEDSLAFADIHSKSGYQPNLMISLYLIVSLVLLVGMANIAISIGWLIYAVITTCGTLSCFKLILTILMLSSVIFLRLYFIEYVKQFYNKLCPMIEWDDKVNEDEAVGDPEESSEEDELEITEDITTY